MEVSVDTYLKGKNLSAYRTVEHEGVVVHVAPALMQWASSAVVATKRTVLRERFAVGVDHEHQPT